MGEEVETSERPLESEDLSLDSLGQHNESLRFRVAEMSERLDDLKSLQTDFSALLVPIVAITEELPRAKVRTAELETLLAMEQGNAATLRRDLADATGRLAAVTNDVAASKIQLHHLETSLQARDAAAEEVRIALRDRTQQAENLERRLFAETEQSRALQGESKALRVEAKALDQALARSDSELQDLRESRHALDRDNLRLQNLSEAQAAQLAELIARAQEFEGQAEAGRVALHTIEQQLAAEVAAARKAEAQSEAEIANHRTERASLAMRVEAATSRLAATEQMLAQLRTQLRERDEAGRSAERGLKEASIERVTLERRLESAQADLARQNERFLEMQRTRSEFEHRCEMLTKAMAAKDAALEQALGRASSLSDRIDHLVHRQEVERADFETVNHRLIEELQHERSERKLAQGALDIARESRVALQKQHEALRRSARSFAADEAARPEPAQAQVPAEPSNVRPFTPAPEK
ncbi:MULTISPECIES: chromosome partitioning protein ParA [Methylobacterium]|uniref:chromosome partitioning protein ParA n=1 Tax=Methylobacterium TaxID=407 RepID=UPI000ABA5F22|nr:MULTISPECIES: chromosome partitioning protein ParA [Methylobacterium]MCI9879656.1 chromosome partitioning protein ParA [Methylobacterium goesingense]